MAVTVLMPAALRPYVENRDRVVLEGQTVARSSLSCQPRSKNSGPTFLTTRAPCGVS